MMPGEPVVWLLHGHKAGDNNQTLALAEALGWPYEIKRLAYRPWELLTNRLLQVTLAGTDPARCSPLEAPWPDLVITCGVRNEPVCRWIREQSAGRTRYLHLGRPWGPLESFDLVVTTPLSGAVEGMRIRLRSEDGSRRTEVGGRKTEVRDQKTEVERSSNAH